MSTTGSAALLSPTGERIDISDGMYETFMSMIGDASESMPGDSGDSSEPGEAGEGPGRLLTTGEGAALLGVSQKTFARIVDRGDIPCVRYGQRGRRRVREDDVRAYLASSRRDMRRGVREAVRIAEEAGLYDIDFSVENAQDDD